MSDIKFDIVVQRSSPHAQQHAIEYCLNLAGTGDDRVSICVGLYEVTGAMY